MSKTLMIVEEEQLFHSLYEVMLEDTGYEIIRAYDGNEELSKLEEKRPDLIILDMFLDIMTGDTFFLHLKGMPEYADIPVIVVSNFPARDFKNLGEVDPNLVYIEKPYLTKERLLEELDIKIK